MKFNEENIKKLREGKATLKADHSKPELMDKVMEYTFPSDDDRVFDHKSNYYRHDDKGLWIDFNFEHNVKSELIELKDFFIENDIATPETAEERDKLVEQLALQINSLNAMEFKKELPSELNNISHVNQTQKEITLLKLLRMRDAYRDGWVVTDVNLGSSIDIDIHKGFVVRNNGVHFVSLLSFQNQETAELFLKNFKKELESVKSLIS